MLTLNEGPAAGPPHPGNFSVAARAEVEVMTVDANQR